MKTPKPGLVAVKFHKEWTIYRAGEIAGFERDKAVALVAKLRVATFVAEDVKVEEKVEPTPSTTIPKHNAVVTDEVREDEPKVEPQVNTKRKPSWLKK